MLIVVTAMSCFGDSDSGTNSNGLTGVLSEDITTLHAHLTTEISKAGTPMENPTAISQIRNELAKRGDGLERGRIIGELRSTNAVVQHHAFESAEYVGGNDMIVALAQLLDDTTGYTTEGVTNKGSAGEVPQGDLVYEPPRLRAAKALAKLVKSPPVLPVGPEKKYCTERDVERWREWWNAHKAEYGQ